MDEGKLWSLIRNVLQQGAAIQLDRASMSGYEEYSARLDTAAADRVADFAKLADARIAELEQSVTVRDTEIARLETDLELARRDGDRYRWLRDNPQHPNHPWFCDRTEKWHAPFEVAPALAVHVPFESLETAIDAARAGNGGEV